MAATPEKSGCRLLIKNEPDPIAPLRQLSQNSITGLRPGHEMTGRIAAPDGWRLKDVTPDSSQRASGLGGKSARLGSLAAPSAS